MKIYLDDERICPEGFVLAKNVSELKQLLLFNNDIVEIDLDHDLGEDKDTGYDFLKWLIEEILDNNITNIPKLVVHSMNPVGRQNMLHLIRNIEELIKCKN